jgi:hypothetical protein
MNSMENTFFTAANGHVMSTAAARDSLLEIRRTNPDDGDDDNDECNEAVDTSMLPAALSWALTRSLSSLPSQRASLSATRMFLGQRNPSSHVAGPSDGLRPLRRGQRTVPLQSHGPLRPRVPGGALQGAQGSGKDLTAGMGNGGVIIDPTRLLVPFAGAIPQHIVASFHARARKHQSVGARFPEFAETHPRNHPDHMRGRHPSNDFVIYPAKRVTLQDERGQTDAGLFLQIPPNRDATDRLIVLVKSSPTKWFSHFCAGQPARLSASAAAAAVVTQKTKGALAGGEPLIE